MKNKVLKFEDVFIVAKQCGEEGSKYHADAQLSILEDRGKGKFRMIEGDAFLSYDLKDLTFEDVTMMLFDRVSARMVERKLWSHETSELAEHKLAEIIGYDESVRFVRYVVGI